MKFWMCNRWFPNFHLNVLLNKNSLLWCVVVCGVIQQVAMGFFSEKALYPYLSNMDVPTLANKLSELYLAM